MRAMPQKALDFLQASARGWVFPREPFGVSLRVSAEMLSRLKVLLRLSNLLRLLGLPSLLLLLHPRVLRFEIEIVTVFRQWPRTMF